MRLAVEPLLFIFIFGMGLGKRVVIGDVNYLDFLAPGILFLVVVNNSFCGIFIPVTDLPNWAQPIIEAIPLTVAVQTARAIALSTGNPYLWQNLAYIITFTIAVFLIGLYLFKKKVIT